MDSLNGSSSVAGGIAKKKPGCWLSPGGIAGIVLGVALVAGAVGTAVYFLHPDRNQESTTSAVIPGTTTTTSTSSTAPTTTPATVTTPADTTTGSTTTISTPATTATTAPPPGMRLPTALVPYHYNVRLRPSFYTNYRLDGTVEIFFTVQAATKQIVVHTSTLVVETGSVIVYRADDPDQTWEVDSWAIDTFVERTTIHLVDDLEVGQSYAAKWDYRGPMRFDTHGLFFDNFYDSELVRHRMVASYLQPTWARNVFPCFDEPNLKATFNITIERQKGYKSYSNTQIIQTIPLADDPWEADVYQTTPRMSTFLLAFVVNDLVCVNTSNDKILIELCARPSLINQTEFAKALAAPMQEFYEDYHNETFPMPKIAHMVIPFMGYDAMENWGLVIYREAALLYDPLTASARHTQEVAGIVAHELAHMWFGNLVTFDWWDDLWLSEGFATYMQELCMDFHFNNEWMVGSQFVASSQQSVMVLDSLLSSHPVHRPVTDSEQVVELFDTITYTKGAAVIRMLHHFLGEEIFRWGIADYLDDRKYQSATHEDLFHFLTEKATDYGRDVNVSAIMNTWILQTGYPVVTFSYDKVTGLVTLSQKHFLVDPSETPSNDLWQVPVTVVDDMDTDADWDEPQMILLTEKDGSINVKADATWIVGNPNAYYYYRVNYDDDMWDALTQQLEDGTHTVIRDTSRAQLLDDSFQLGKAGLIDQLVAMRISDYLDHEEDYTPWVAAARNLKYLANMFQHSVNKDIFELYMQTRVAGIYNKTGWQDTPGEPHLTQLLRTLALDTACQYSMPDCIDRSSSLYQQWMDNVEKDGSNAANPIDTNLRAVVYCSAIKQGGGNEWNFAFDQYMLAESSEKTTLLNALTCADEIHLLSHLVELSMNPRYIHRSDFKTVMTGVASKENGRFVVWNYLRFNWDEIFQFYGWHVFDLPTIVTGVTENFSSDFELTELQLFLDSHESLGGTGPSFLQAIETTNNNIQWRAANEQKIVDWIETELGL